MRASTAMPQIMKIVRLVVKFHPLLTVTNLIFGVIFLHDWIKEEVSNQWKILKVYCQSIMRALLDPVTEKMENLSKGLQMHFNNEAAKGQLKAKLIGKLALFSATFLLLDTEWGSNFDKRGTKTQLLLLVGLHLLEYSKYWSELRILRGSCACATNLTSNFTFFILAFLFEKFYDNSLRSLCSVLCIAVFFLCLLVILQPQTDFGLFSFIIGIVGSITYNRYGFKFPMWIIAFNCFVLFSFKSWIDKYWLDLKEGPSTNTIARSSSMLFLFSSIATFMSQANFIFKYLMSDYKNWFVNASGCVLWSLRFHKLYLIPKDSSLPSINNNRISGLILIVVNVAQGIFTFALAICLVTDYKDWLFAVISYIVFCFWVRSFSLKNLSSPSTNTKGMIGMIWSLLSVAKYGVVVLAGLEPHMQYREWLSAVVWFVLWWVRLHMSFSKDLLQFTIAEFKAPQWWITLIFSTTVDVIPCIELFTTHYQQQG